MALASVDGYRWLHRLARSNNIVETPGIPLFPSACFYHSDWDVRRPGELVSRRLNDGHQRERNWDPIGSESFGPAVSINRGQWRNPRDLCGDLPLPKSRRPVDWVVRFVGGLSR
jgi:hypothetical protein